MTRLPRLLALASALTGASAAQAADFNALELLNQQEFRLLAEDLSAATSFKPLIPSEGLGITGFDIGISAGATMLQNRDVLSKAAGGASLPKALPLVGVRVHKGLPFDIDLGASLATLPGTNARMSGGELRWAVVSGGAIMPAVALRASVSSVSGVDELKLRTTGFDVSISKGFLMLTPYAGVGTVSTKASAPGTSLGQEKFTKTKVFAGANFNLGLMNLAVETDKTGDATSYGLKLGLRF